MGQHIGRLTRTGITKVPQGDIMAAGMQMAMVFLTDTIGALAIRIATRCFLTEERSHSSAIKRGHVFRPRYQACRFYRASLFHPLAAKTQKNLYRC